MNKNQIEQFFADLPQCTHDTAPVHVRLSRLGNNRPHIVYDGDSALYVQYAPAYKKLPARFCTIAVRAFDWAECSMNDLCDDGSFVVEDYQMEIIIP